MNIEPCVRFGICISPKINEKPADNRKSRPPNVMLLMANTAQILMSGVPAPRLSPRPSRPDHGGASGRSRNATSARHVLQAVTGGQSREYAGCARYFLTS